MWIIMTILGYKRNERFIVLRDYIEVSENNLLNVLRNFEIVLVGDRYLCSRLYEYLGRNMIPVIGYLHTLREDVQPENMPKVPMDKY